MVTLKFIRLTDVNKSPFCCNWWYCHYKSVEFSALLLRTFWVARDRNQIAPKNILVPVIEKLQ